MIEYGCHTFSLFHRLSYSEVQNLIEMLQKQGKCRKIKADRWNMNRTYYSDLFSQHGVLIYLYQHLNGGSGITLRVTPCTVLNNFYAATELYQPTRKNYRRMTKILDQFLDALELEFRADDMSISRCDPCANLHLENKAAVAEYLRLFRKAQHIRHYKVVTYEKNNKFVKNPQEANRHSYRQSSKRASFTAYDKVYVLQQLERCPKDLAEKGVLRVEAELDREALLKRIDANQKWSNYRILKESYRAVKKILCKYFNRLFGGHGNFICYQKAKERIESAKMSKKTRERMLYLLRKTSDSNTLDYAVLKMRRKFELSQGQCNHILKKFEKLNISPITLRNDSKFDELPSFLTLFLQNRE